VADNLLFQRFLPSTYKVPIYLSVRVSAAVVLVTDTINNNLEDTLHGVGDGSLSMQSQKTVQRLRGLYLAAPSTSCSINYF